MTAAAAGHGDLAISNAIGGIAAQTAFLVVADVAYRRANLEHAAASLPNMISASLLILLLALVAAAHVLPEVAVVGVHPATPVLFAVYMLGVGVAAKAHREPSWRPHATRDTVDETGEPRAPEESSGRLAVGLLVLGLVVGVAGWAIAESAILIAKETGVREGLIGAFLTSIITSSPELVTTLAASDAARLRSRSAAFSAATASTCCSPASPTSPTGTARSTTPSCRSRSSLSWLSIVMTAIVLVGLLNRERHGPGNIGFESVALLSVYIGGAITMAWAF